MADIHIEDFIKGRTQQQVAEILGVTQGAVFQALAAKRNIYFRELEGGLFEIYEIKRPRKKKAA